MTDKMGGPAFPVPLNPGQEYQAHCEWDGMLMWDYYAAHATATR